MRLVHCVGSVDEITAVFNGDRLEELCIDLPDALAPQTICTAKALKPVAGGWFVDIGGRTAFLEKTKAFIGLDGRISAEPLSEGCRLIVQIRHAAAEDKEIKVSADVTLASKAFVYTPCRSGITFSRDLPQDVKTTLLPILKAELNSPTESFTVRTAAVDFESTALIEDLNELRSLWAAVAAEAQTRHPVAWEPPRTVFQLAEAYAGTLNEIVTDHAQTALGLKGRFPFTALVLNALRQKEALEQVVEEALLSKADLPGGGSLIVERTAAVVCFDVNAGGSDWDEVNRQAVAEIARQIRIKGLSGQMIVDFAGKKDKNKVRKWGEELVEMDPALDVWGVSNLGLLEMTKRRGRACLWDVKGERK